MPIIVISCLNHTCYCCQILCLNWVRKLNQMCHFPNTVFRGVLQCLTGDSCLKETKAAASPSPFVLLWVVKMLCSSVLASLLPSPLCAVGRHLHLTGVGVAWFVAATQFQSYRCKNILAHLLLLFTTVICLALELFALFL